MLCPYFIFTYVTLLCPYLLSLTLLCRYLLQLARLFLAQCALWRADNASPSAAPKWCRVPTSPYVRTKAQIQPRDSAAVHSFGSYDPIHSPINQPIIKEARSTGSGRSQSLIQRPFQPGGGQRCEKGVCCVGHGFSIAVTKTLP